MKINSKFAKQKKTKKRYDEYLQRYCAIATLGHHSEVNLSKFVIGRKFIMKFFQNYQGFVMKVTLDQILFPHPTI